MHFMCNWRCKSAGRPAGAARSLQGEFCVWIEVQVCEDHSGLLSSWPCPNLCNTTLEGWSDPWWLQCALTTSEPFHSSKQHVKNDSSEWKEHVTGGWCELFSLITLNQCVTFIPLVFQADSLFLNCHAYVLCLTQKHLSNKLWFMTPLKGVIWGFWWKPGEKCVSPCCQFMQGSASCDHLHPLPFWHPKVQASHPVVKRGGDRIH